MTNKASVERNSFKPLQIILQEKARIYSLLLLKKLELKRLRVIFSRAQQIWQSTLEDLQNEKENLSSMLRINQAELTELNEDLKYKNSFLQIKQEHIEHLEEVEQHLLSLLNYQSRDMEKESLYYKLELANKENERLSQENERLSQKILMANEDIVKLVLLLNKLQSGVLNLLDSKRWKIGNALGELQRKIVFRSQLPMPEQFIENILLEYNEWERNYNDSI